MCVCVCRGGDHQHRRFIFACITNLNVWFCHLNDLEDWPAKAVDTENSLSCMDSLSFESNTKKKHPAKNSGILSLSGFAWLTTILIHLFRHCTSPLCSTALVFIRSYSQIRIYSHYIFKQTTLYESLHFSRFHWSRIATFKVLLQ